MPEPTPAELPSLEQMHARHLREKIADVANRLRQMADRIEAEAASTFDSGRAVLRYSRAAEAVTHEIHWGVANLGLPSLASEAAEADIARAEAGRLASPSDEAGRD
ncbi:Uncharacterised protein [Mycobacteroides abscessus subsp. abscessus]|nr:Uncharacterised protein [Mycobacteroides abscessus subsp. abscessus]